MALALTVVVLKSALKITRHDYKRWAWASRILQPIRFSSFTICQDVTSGCSGSLSILFSLHRESGCYFRRGNESVRLVTSWALSLWHYDTLKERLMCVCCSGSRRAAGCDATSLRGGFQDLKNVCFHRQTVRQGGRMFQSSSWTQTCCLLWLTECGRTMQK